MGREGEKRERRGGDHDGRAYEGERFDDTESRVVGIADGLTLAKTERGFPAVEGFVFLVCGGRLAELVSRMNGTSCLVVMTSDC